jgi:hypothetical protein
MLLSVLSPSHLSKEQHAQFAAAKSRKHLQVNQLPQLLINCLQAQLHTIIQIP